MEGMNHRHHVRLKFILILTLSLPYIEIAYKRKIEVPDTKLLTGIK